MKIGSKTKVTREVTRQERNRRNNMKRITISALVAFILFIALTIIQSSILNQETKVTVYQVQKDIASGTKITEDNFDTYFSTKAVQASLIPDGYITDKSLMLNKFVDRDYKARDVITVDGLNDSEGSYNSNIKHPTKLSFQAGSLSDSVAGTLREGDYINVYGMKNGKNGDGEVVLLTNNVYTFKHIYIDKAYNSAGEVIDSADKDTEALMFTVIIEEDDVPLFNEMVANCNLKFVKLMYDTDQDYKAFISKGVDTSINGENNNQTVVNENNVVIEDENTNASDGNDNGTQEEDSLATLKEEIENRQDSSDETESSSSSTSAEE